MKFVWAFFLAALLWSSASASAGTRSTLTVNGNQLLLNGAPVRLVGYGDPGILAEKEFDYEAHFKTLKCHGLNMVRVGVQYPWANSLMPYEGMPRDVNDTVRRNRYNLTAKNKAFYQRLEKFVRAAERYGIVVQLCLFDATALESGANDPEKQHWANAPFNADNNRNGYIKTPAEFFALNTPLWNTRHTSVIDNVVSTVGKYGNVIYEIGNELDTARIPGVSRSTVVAFTRAVAIRLRDQLARQSGSKIISLQVGSAEFARLVTNAAEWGGNNPISLASVHLRGSNVTDAFLAGLARCRPVIISNDGHKTQASQNYESALERVAALTVLLNRVFLNRTADGVWHFDMLDRGFNGSTWPSGQNFAPRAQNIDARVLRALQRSSVLASDCK